MFVKLLKYDIKAIGRLIVPTYLILVLLATVSRVVHLLLNANPDNMIFQMMNGICLVVLVLGLIFVNVAAVIMTLIRFRSNLLKDEGYLMHTLPVTVTQLFYSKLLAALLYIFANLLVSAFMMAFATWTWKLDLSSAITGIAAKDLTTFIALMILYMVIGIIVSQIQIFASLGIGYTLKGNKDLMSFGVYIAIYVVTQVIGILSIALTYFSYPDLLKDINQNVMPFDLIVRLFGFLGIFMIFLGLALQYITIYRMKHKLNLE